MSATNPASIAARVDRLPSCRPLWGWVARISFGAFFEIYETALTSLLAPMLVREGVFHSGRNGLFGLPDLASLAFATFGGLFVGALLVSSLSDRFGRRPIFTYSLIWYAAATVMMSLQHDAIGICLWRFIAAIGIGAEIVAVDAYLSEVMPKSLRGRGFAISTAIQFTAVPVAGILAAVLAHRRIDGIEGWRLLLLVPVIGAALIWRVRRGLPESPRWLAGHGQGDQAARILDAIEAKVERRTGRPMPAPELVKEPVHIAPEGGYRELFSGEIGRRVLIMLVASCTATFAYFGFNNWLPTLLEAKGVSLAKSLGYSAAIAVSFPLAPLFFSLFADRIERKWQIVIGAGVTAVAGLAFAMQTSAFGWIACGLAIAIAANLLSYGLHTYRSELFPTRVRGRAIGFVYSLDRLSASSNGYIIGYLLISFGVAGVLAGITAAAVVSMGTIAIFGPPTRVVAAQARG
ncbi:MFS transporter [uncultured Sphingomonas sp.]|uniref:MFS transporter n=1 Tax=uncultured Sphingomonas sp. TaxID=158754 RepID=UPI0035CAFBD9